jgi:hypothetical protein
MERKSFIFHAEWAEAAKKLPKDVRVEVYDAIIEYGLSGIASAALKPVAEALFTVFRARLDADRTKYESKVQRLREVGKKGGEANAKHYQALASISKHQGSICFRNASIVNDIVNVKETISNDIAKKDEVVGDNRKKYGERVAMTETEYAALCESYGEAFTTEQISVADDWLLANGKTQKNYAAFMRNWLKKAQARARLNASSNFGRGGKTGGVLSQESTPNSQESAAFLEFFDNYPTNRQGNRYEAWQAWQLANLDAKPKLAQCFADFVNVNGIAYGAKNLLAMLKNPDAATKERFNARQRRIRDDIYTAQIITLENTMTVDTQEQTMREIKRLKDERDLEYPYI